MDVNYFITYLSFLTPVISLLPDSALISSGRSRYQRNRKTVTPSNEFTISNPPEGDMYMALAGIDQLLDSLETRTDYNVSNRKKACIILNQPRVGNGR